VTLGEEFATWLAQHGHGAYSTDGGDIFIEAMPTGPDEAIAVTEYPGGEPDSRIPFDEAKVQIRCRGTADPSVSRTKANAIYADLQGLTRATLPGGTRLMLAVATPPAPMGRDQNGRYEYVVNVRAQIGRPTTHRA
jgi:hypothetical protein